MEKKTWKRAESTDEANADQILAAASQSREPRRRFPGNPSGRVFAPGRASRTSPHTQRRRSDSGLAPRVQGPSHAQRPAPPRTAGPSPATRGPRSCAHRPPPAARRPSRRPREARARTRAASVRWRRRGGCRDSASLSPGQPGPRALRPSSHSPSLPAKQSKAKQSKKDRDHWWSFYHRPAVPMLVEKNKNFPSGMQNGADNLENIPGAALKD